MFLSHATLAATVVVNPRVSLFDRLGDPRRGDRIDLACPWLHPAGYGAGVAAIVGYFVPG